ncbi:hypothetical protein BDY19DRAFT_923768 [Irpex rosettiformis]|uniref:Uncharacterized protein n=1 Tax=Irpex rosettiformis TaxID=378272 RepID=A0ACB8UGN8_9APHY|nr:hypothetical protein BDY19DRAFT_923768 [Irpex rosettiformis]
MFVARNALRLSGRNGLTSGRIAIRNATAVRTLATYSTLLDVTREIKLDHDNVRDLFARFGRATDQKEKTLIANTLIREMFVHSDAEEVSVYNVYARLGLDDTVQHNKEDHAEIKQLLWQVEHNATDVENYDSILGNAVNVFLAHAAEEENVQHPKIRERLDVEQNDQIARTFIKARNSIPTHAYPLAPQTGGPLQKAMGIHGRVQEKMAKGAHSREYVDLKFEHPEV